MEQDGAITNLQVAALRLSKPSSLSAPTYLSGSPVSGTAGTEIEDNDWEFAIKEIQLKTQHLDVITSLKSEEVRKVVEELKAQKVLNDLEDLVEYLEKFSKLNKRLRKYKKSDPAETWASRWIASLIAYLFPPERREEWLGDLYEVNREMLHKDYPRWLVNLNNVWKTLILVISALKIRLSDFFSLAKLKSK
ncbi:hypothetical protein LC653_33445 [Nostoc sp. CHAB 5784]|uniref:hypothetical protein n=1 Tax=Nostoc mirabile TaxID=2907820 RepID=UPI001E602AF5|nr:hypothetical protein [Nostoc mirabile]MCC5668627.1 hypothetical protein [Nostoc mirabile CHAB5784]